MIGRDMSRDNIFILKTSSDKGYNVVLLLCETV